MNLTSLETDIGGKKTIVYLVFLIIGGFITRYIFTPYEIPLVLDSLQYFWYGIELSILNEFPSNYDLTNNIWPTFLSPFFSILDSQNYLDYMNLQRNISIIFSVMTAIPIYFLAKKFLPNTIALIAPIMLIFEPRIILNSTSGITEPIFLFFIISSFALFFNKNKKYLLSSFILIGLACLARYEALVIVFPMVIMLFFRLKNEKYRMLYPILAIMIFLIVITPMSIIKIETMGYDGIFSHVIAGANVAVRDSITSEPETQQFFLEMGIWKFFKLFVWTTLPTYIIFFPLGVFIFFKNKKRANIELIILGIISLIPAFYAASRGIEETRYYFIFYPLFIIFSLYFIQWIRDRWRIRYIKLVCVGFVVITSFMFIILKDNNEYESEAFHVVRENFSDIKTVNDLHPYSPYFRAMPLHLSESFPIERNKLIENTVILGIDDFDSIYELFESNEGKEITHLIIDDSSSRKDFLKDLFEDEVKYPFLEKIYDSTEEGLEHHVKIFRFDSAKFINLHTDENR
jgi:hypothetical protein